MSDTYTVLQASDAGLEAMPNALQRGLVDLVELYWQTKQLHWTAVGPGFRSLHESLDLMAAEILPRVDELAERMRALHGTPNIRTAEVAASTNLEPLPLGEPTVVEAISHITTALARVVLTLEEVCQVVEAIDPPTVDILRSTMLVLDKNAWLLRAELSPCG